MFDEYIFLKQDSNLRGQVQYICIYIWIKSSLSYLDIIYTEIVTHAVMKLPSLCFIC